VPLPLREEICRASAVVMDTLTLPGGMTLRAAVASLPRDMARFIGLTIERMAVLGGAAQVHAAQRPAVLVSLQVAQWMSASINAVACNIWSPTRLEGLRGSVLDTELAVLPLYENPGHHDPDSSARDPAKSLLPVSASRMLISALPEDQGRTTWWAYCEHRFFHRFAGSRSGIDIKVHWNGTTNPNAKQTTAMTSVPSWIMPALKPFVVLNCGCREL